MDFLDNAAIPDLLVFAVGAVLVMVGAFGVVLARNPVHAALSLIASFLGIAVMFILQGAQFLAVVQVIVYTGAIAVLFLFVIMLLGVDRVDRDDKDPIKFQRPLALVLSLAVAGLLIALARWDWNATGAPSQGGVASGPGSNVAKLADSLFTQYFFAFEVTSVLLVIAVIGAVVLARRPSEQVPEIPVNEINGDDEDEEELEMTAR